MSILRDEEDREVRDEELILEQVYKYYTELYTQPTVSAAEKHEQDKVLTLIDQLVSEEENLQLTALPGAEELRNMVKDLPSDKSPGEDGLLAEVLHELWDEISPCCLKFIQEPWHSKRIGKYNTRAIIPKNEKKDDLRN
ncbi:hypothetical protein R1flu_014805 [Riccia fluitans]|uniref:Uncharacterized protein n=1 Tax=Riccia fluitans TaxID=41844 RepID=A0ABD1YI93_9MARC